MVLHDCIRSISKRIKGKRINEHVKLPDIPKTICHKTVRRAGHRRATERRTAVFLDGGKASTPRL
jgi:hypothetical protein